MDLGQYLVQQLLEDNIQEVYPKRSSDDINQNYVTKKEHWIEKAAANFNYPIPDIRFAFIAGNMVILTDEIWSKLENQNLEDDLAFDGPAMVLNYDDDKYYLVYGGNLLRKHKELNKIPKVLMGKLNVKGPKPFPLKEGLDKNILNKFLKFAIKELDLKKLPSKITLSKDVKKARTKHTFGTFAPDSNAIWLYINNRNTADILRTLAHELVHRKQEEDGRLKPNSGETGSEIENEANAQAGILLRKFGEQNPMIYEANFLKKAIIPLALGASTSLSTPNPEKLPNSNKPSITTPIKKETEISFPHSEILLRQAYKESGFNPEAVSSAGATGLTQVMPSAVEDYLKRNPGEEIDLYNPEHSIKIQVDNMKDLYNASFIKKENQPEIVRLAKTLAAYNYGRGNLFDFLNKVKEEGIDIYNSLDWIEKLPKETYDYINKILLKKNPKFEKEYTKAIKKNPHIKNYYTNKTFNEGKLTYEGIYGNYLFGDKNTGVAIEWYKDEIEPDTPAEKNLFSILKKYANSEYSTYSAVSLDDFIPIFKKLKKQYPEIADPKLSPDKYIYRGTSLPKEQINRLLNSEAENIIDYEQGYIIPNQTYQSKRKVQSWSINYFTASGFAFTSAAKKGGVAVIMRAKVSDADLYFTPEFMDKLSTQAEDETFNIVNPIPVDIMVMEFYEDEFENIEAGYLHTKK